MQHIRAHVLVCGGTGCKSAGSGNVIESFKTEIEKKGLSDEVMVVELNTLMVLTSMGL